jgi:hypothetical protein
MPSVFIPAPQFPNVPFLAGVPQLVRSALFKPATNVTLGTGAPQNQLWASSKVAPVWGVYDQDNNLVIFPDNVYAFSDRAEWNKPKYPVQNGSFASYNKVVIPFENSIRMTKGGSLTDRKNFLAQIDAIAGDLNQYNIMTPEKTYVGVNVSKRELIRTSSAGAYFIEIDLYFEQINQFQAQYSTTAANTSNAQNPSALPAVNLGNVQPQSVVPTNVQAIAANAISQAPL